MISNLKDLWRRLTTPRATDEDEAPREDIANVIAERERLLAAERAQARRQAALLRLSAELAATLEEAEVCRRVVDGLHDTLGYDHLVLWLVDETTGDRVLAASVGFVEPPTRVPPGRGLSERPLLDGQLHYTPDVSREPRYYPGAWGSEVDVPVRIGGKVLGVLTAESRELHAFSQDDFEVLTAAAQQTGLAIEKARLLAAERQRADELDALRTTMADITAELELSSLLQAIVERAAGLLDATGGELGLYDEASQQVRIVISHNLGEGYVGTRHALGEGAMGRVAETREPLIIEDYLTWEGRAPQYADIYIHASLNAPLQVGGRLVGVISIAAVDPDRQFGLADLHLLNLFAQQAAIAIENARLFDQAQRRVAELATLTEVGKALSSTLRVDEVLQLIYEQTRRVMYAEDMIIALYDQARHELECAFSTNPDDIPAGSRGSSDTGLGGYIIKHRKSLLLRSNVTERGRELGVEPIGLPAASWLGAPMLIGERVLGLIIVQHYTTPNVYDESHQVLLETIASQAAIAIENARLYDQAQREIAERKRAEEEAQRRAAQAALIYEVGRRVSGELELEALLSEIVTVVRDAFDYYSVALGLLDEEAEYLAVWADAGAYADMFSEDHRIAIGEGMTGYAAATGETQISGDVSKDPHYIRVEEEETKSELAVPVKSGQKVIGVLDLESKEFDAFDETDVMLMETLADQVAVAIENAWLFEQAQEEIAERERAEAELRKYQEHLEELVEERTAELRESEERYRTLFDGVPVGVYRTTPAGQFMDANLAMVQMLGFPDRETLLATNTADLYANPQDRVQWQVLMEREGVVRDFEVQNRRYDGTVIWLNDTARAVRDEQSQVLYYEGSIEDVTERKRAEAELRKYQEHLEELVEERTADLRESEERYRTLFDGVPVGLYRTTPTGQVLDANLAVVQMFGYSDREEALLAVNTADLYVDPEDRMRWQALMEREGVVHDFEYRVRRYDGTVIWLSDTARVVKDEQGQVLYYEGSLEDITERKEFEEEIRRQKDYYEALFVNNPVAVLTADLDANVVSWNPMAEKLFGYTQEEAIGQNVDDLVAKDPRVREEALDYTKQVFREGRVQATTKRTRKDGSLVDVEVLALPVIVAGEMVGYIAIYHDISELQLARRTAEAANQAKSVFLANMSHELRTPLNAILGFTQLMDRDPNLTAGQQENLGIINRSGEHLLALINDVLEMSKIEAGRVTLEERSFDLYRLLDGLEEMFGLRAKDKGLALSFERAENVPQYVRTDEGKLRQVLSNLLGNAVKFTQEGGVVLRVGTKDEEPVLSLSKELRTKGHPSSDVRRSSLVFEVEDTGPGMAPEDLAVVFDPFVQATSGQEPQEGTGLGLSISRQYVRLMGGDITVSSELGQGSLFKFDVQVGLADAAEVQAAQPRRRVLGLEPNQPIYRLLVAEDKETNRQLLVKLLKPLGFEVQEAVNGHEAIEVWERWEPHLIWMDMRMPVMDGYEATRRIKATTKGQTTVIIALTATAFEEDRERVLLEGCDDFVRKPFREDEIFDVLAKHLGVRFVYQEELALPAMAQPADAAAPPTEVLSPAALAALPASWVADLQQATIKADLSLILTLIDQIRGENPALADALADLARGFEYKKILTFIEQAGGQR